VAPLEEGGSLTVTAGYVWILEMGGLSGSSIPRWKGRRRG